MGKINTLSIPPSSCAEVEAVPARGLNKKEFEHLWMAHRKVFSKIIYDFVVISYDWLNENDVMDICQDILSQVLEGAYKKRHEYDKSWKYYTWIRPRIISRCLDYFSKSYISHEVGDYKPKFVGGDDEEEDTSDKKYSFFSDNQQYIDWENSGRGDIGHIVDHPVDKNIEYMRKKRDDYLKDKLETLISIKDIREYKRQNPEYTLPETLELLPYLSDCELDIAISLAKREPREKIAKEQGIPNKKTLDKIISRMAKKRR